MSLDLRYARAFLSTARHLNFSAAARELKIAQSAVSRQIKLFEDSINAQLIVRSAKSVQLTPQGQIIFQKLQEFERWSDSMQRQDAPVRILAMEGVASCWLAERASKLLQAHPEVELHIRIAGAETMAEVMQKGEADFALGTQKVQSALASSTKLFKERFVLISAEKVKLIDVHEHPWIYIHEGSYLSRVCKVDPPKRLRAGSIPILLKLVESGCGIAIVAEHLLDGHVGKLVRQPVASLQDEWMYLTSLHYDLMPNAIKVVRDALTR
jgi:DNA-binding transcriptional LysR family regulator